MGNQQNSGLSTPSTPASAKRSAMAKASSLDSATSDAAAAATPHRRAPPPPLQHRHTTPIPTVTLTDTDERKTRRVSEGSKVISGSSPCSHNYLMQQQVSVQEVEEEEAEGGEDQDGGGGKKKVAVPLSPSLQRLNNMLGRATAAAAAVLATSPKPSQHRFLLSPPAAAAASAAAGGGAAASTTSPSSSPAASPRRSRRSVAAVDPSGDATGVETAAAADVLDESSNSSSSNKGHHLNAMNFFSGRRIRRSSDHDQGPINIKTPSTGPPPVPPEEIYDPSQDTDPSSLDNGDGGGTANGRGGGGATRTGGAGGGGGGSRLSPPQQPRARARTIGNGQTAFNKQNRQIIEAAMAAKRRKEEKKKFIPTVFRFPGAAIPKASETKVYLFGTMTQWKCVEMTRPPGETDFIRILDCTEGKVFYKFCVDGQFRHDGKQPTRLRTTDNRSWNLIAVQKADNDVFEALACDSFSLRDSRLERGHQNDVDRDEAEVWTQERPTETFVNSPRHKGPPLLPPHLLQVLLNKDLPNFNDPVLLPEPSHVTLDHLYAQSIRDATLVLSTTTRYRKKCVTMVLYRPI